MKSDIDAIIIGAGPSGMSAANVMHEFGCKVVVLDEQAGPGGQIYKAIERVKRDRPAELNIIGKEYSEGARLAGKFRSQAEDYRTESTVWHIEELVEKKCYNVFYSRRGISQKVSAKYLIIASGAMERPVPIPGWTLPGVVTVGALQSALKNSGVYPTCKVVLAGSGPLVLQLASQFIAAKVKISAILDTTPRGNVIRTLRYFPRALLAGKYLFKGWQLNRDIKKSGVKIYRNVSHLKASGHNKVENISFESNDTLQNIKVNMVALHEGIVPNTQLTRLLELKHEWSEQQRSFAPVVDSLGESSRSGIFVVGDGAGIFGSKTAEYNGVIAGICIAERLGYVNESFRDLIVEDKKHRRFLDMSIRPFLDTLFPPPKKIGLVHDETIICRCEEITAGEIRSIVARGCSGPNQAKAFLRCGMGVCQGRMCGASVTEVISEALGKTPLEVGSFRIRPPIKPLSLQEVATLSDG